jgi:KDO2-lipid IV(A) lauroyltransferase
VIYWIHVAACALMRLIPVEVAYRVVTWGTPVFLTFFARGHRRRAMANMRQVLGPTASERDVHRLTLQAFTNYSRYMVDLLRLPYLDVTEMARDVVFHGWENVEAAFSQGLGVVIVTGHIGSWDMAGAIFVGKERSIGVLTDTLTPARWNDRVQRIRAQVGMRAIPIESGVREMLATLRSTRVPNGAATLALRTGSPVLPAAFVHAPNGSGYVAYIGQPIPVERHARSAAETQALTQRIMGWLEGVIRQHPDQWYMFRPMWPST